MGRVVVDSSTCKYYEDRSRMLTEIAQPDEKCAFVFQTFLAFQKDGCNITASPSICRVLEGLLPISNTECLVVLLKTLSKNWRAIICSKFGHHLLQKTLVKCLDEPFCTDPLIRDFVSSFLEHVSLNLDSYIGDPFARFTLRLYPQLVAGVRLEKDVITNAYSVKRIRIYQPFETNYADILDKLIDRFLLASDVYSHCRNESISPFLQVLMVVSYARNISLFTENLGKIAELAALFSKTKKKQSLSDGFIHPVLVYFTELMIGFFPGKHFAAFLEQIVSVEKEQDSEDKTGNRATIQIMASHPIASRIFRAVIRRLKKTADLETILGCLESDSTEDGQSRLEKVINKGQHAVLNELATKCSQEGFTDVQRIFVKMLFTSLGHSGVKPQPNTGEDPLIRCIVGLVNCHKVGSLIPDESDESEQTQCNLCEPVTLPGCLLAQKLFSYHTARPTLLAASLCTQSSARLQAWAKHPMLSRVLESALLSDSVPISRKSHLLDVLEVDLMDIVRDRYGSRVVEALWTAVDSMPEPDVLKERLVAKLVNSRVQLSTHPFGHFVHHKLQLDLFADAPSLWRKRVLHSHGLAQKRSTLVSEPKASKRSRKTYVPKSKQNIKQ
ncbi:hypothetical protein EG68_01275 [Paragonimus skrjabini miyazakii]|uniref:Nucleolar protein 9 n=1 Tax=Paragonimus skrjabini miyazakii TaxID=59628 RepID=A0A8S9Z108_9TREM|nr:hypothetical protein EG68_01275 [Paragonimus skrjabini miyazakii]